MQSTAHPVLGVVLALLLLLGTALPAMATPTNQGRPQVCDERSYDSKIDGAEGHDSGAWGSLHWEGDPGTVEVTVTDGYVVHLCVKGGHKAFGTGSLATLEPSQDTVIEVGTQVSHVAWSVVSAADEGGGGSTGDGDPVTSPDDDEVQPPVTPGNGATPPADDPDQVDTVADPGTDPRDRVGGGDRRETAVEISQMTYPDGADVAFVARDDLFPDALAAGPLAAARRGPILLTDSEVLSAVTAAELDRLDAADGDDDLRVVVLGGPAAVSTGAYAALDRTHATERIGGVDRFHTAALIAEELDGGGQVRTVYVATGRDYPDAMIAGWASGLTDGAVLLAEVDDISDYTIDALRSLDAQQVYAVGGSAVLSDDVVERLGATRVAGPDRYATTAKVATMVVDRVGPPDVVYLTTGGSFADTLTIAPTAILGGDAVLLVGADLPDAVRTALATWAPQRVTAVGGPAAVSDSVLSAAAP